ncbi:MAG: homoserine kinase [Thermoanaerobaculia bacterium]
MTHATVFAPGSIGNVGPGFDVLGLAVEGIGDTVTVELIDGDDAPVEVTGRDAALVPADPTRNAAAIAARAALSHASYDGGIRVAIEKGLPLAGGIGGSAASSVGGALAALMALAKSRGATSAPDRMDVIAAALAGETAVAGPHLDNIVPCALGGLGLSRSVDPIDAIRLPVAAEWWIALVTPKLRIETKAARAILPAVWGAKGFVQLMANTAGLMHAFATGDAELLGRSLIDVYAEPRRKELVPHFDDVKSAAIGAGAFGGSLSGSGPTIFAIAPDEATARRVADAMQHAFAEVASTAHVGPIAREGAREVA